MPGWNSIIDRLEDQMSEEQVQAAISKVVRDKVHPHFDDVRKEARSADDPDEVREKFEEMSEERKDEVFHDTWGRLIAQSFRLRDSPVRALKELKVMLRDPYTMEALLLIMDHGSIPAETQEAQKDLLSEYVHALGVGMMPEAYTREEVEEAVSKFGRVDTESVLDDYDDHVDSDEEQEAD